MKLPHHEHSELVYIFQPQCALIDTVFLSCCKPVMEDGLSHGSALGKYGVTCSRPTWDDSPLTQGNVNTLGSGGGPGGGIQISSRPSTHIKPHTQNLCGEQFPGVSLNAKGNILYHAFPLGSEMHVSWETWGHILNYPWHTLELEGLLSPCLLWNHCCSHRFYQRLCHCPDMNCETGLGLDLRLEEEVHILEILRRRKSLIYWGIRLGGTGKAKISRWIRKISLHTAWFCLLCLLYIFHF